MTEPTIKCSKCQTEFPKYRLRCIKCNEIGVSKLYKYVRCCEHSLNILKEKTIWFSAAESLNDPFEFNFYCPEMHVNGISINTDSFETAVRDMKKMGVMSLSEINNNILMWSHYSESHTGFCIEFERTDSNNLGNGLYCMPVLYDENIPILKPIELTDPKTVKKILITKSELWSYEKEWRVVAKKGNQKYPLPGNITGVIFGYKMLITKQQEIAAILEDTVTYKQAIKSLSKFAVDIQPITLSEIKAG